MDFGVQKVIWIYTDTRKVMSARQAQKWEIADWTETIELIDNLEINLDKMVEKL